MAPMGFPRHMPDILVLFSQHQIEGEHEAIRIRPEIVQEKNVLVGFEDGGFLLGVAGQDTLGRTEPWRLEALGLRFWFGLGWRSRDVEKAHRR